MKIQLKNEKTDVTKEASVGFSWLTLFIGCFDPLFRGDIKWAVISLICSVLTGLGFWLVFPFIYNKIYIKDLLEKGYIPANTLSDEILKQKGYLQQKAF